MTNAPFSGHGDCVKLTPNAGSDNDDVGTSGHTLLVVNSSSVVVHIKTSSTASPTATATDTPLGASQAITISRPPTHRYVAAYSAGDASSGVYVQAGGGL